MTPLPINLPSISPGLRALFSGYLMVVGLGFLMTGVQILLTHGMADGKLGLSVNDIVYSYYGNRGGSKLESKLNGSMKDKAPVHVRTAIIEWVRAGSPEAQWEGDIQLLFQNHCVMCHSAIPGLPDFKTYAGVKTRAQIDEGASIDSLTRVSHIHLFGIAFIFFFVCLIFSLATGVNNTLKQAAIALPFAFLIFDVFSWWATKWVPEFAWITIIMGFGYATAFTYMWFTSMYQMWILPRTGKTFDGNEWVRTPQPPA